MAIKYRAHGGGVTVWQLQFNRVHAATDRLGHRHWHTGGGKLFARSVQFCCNRAGLCYQPGDEHRLFP